MGSMVIDFNGDGTVEAMHRDGFPLSFLGSMQVRRASELLFNEATQDWYIQPWTYPNGATEPTRHAVPEASGFASYEDARRVEVAWFDACRREGVSPVTPEGVSVLLSLNEGVCHERV